MLSIMVVAFWLLMSDSFTLGQIVLGLLLGVVVPLFAARLDREFARIGTLRPLPAGVRDPVGHPDVQHPRRPAGAGPEKNIHPGFIWLPLDIANIHGIAALTSMITLTRARSRPRSATTAGSCWCTCCTWRTPGPDRYDQAPLRGAVDGDLPMTGFEVIQTTLVVCMHVVGLAMLLATWRLLRGPTVPDRILALDTLSVTAIAELMLFGMYLNSPIYFEAALIIAMLGFGSTVVLSKFVLRRDIVE